MKVSQDEAKYEKNKTNDTRPAAICYPIDQSESKNVHVH